MARKTSSGQQAIGEVFRSRRLGTLKRGLRKMGRTLGIAPPHLSDIEEARATPSEGLLMRIIAAHALPEPDLRSGRERANGIVAEVATQGATTAQEVPEFLRVGRKLTPEQWDRLIGHAEAIAGSKER